MTWRTKNQRGQKTSSVLLGAEDLVKGELSYVGLTSTADIVPHYDVVPEHVILPCAASETVIRIRANYDPPVEVIGVKPLDPNVQFTASVGAGGAVVITPPESLPLKQSPRIGRVRIETDSERQPNAFVQVEIRGE